jgi:hypothetical protein
MFNTHTCICVYADVCVHTRARALSLTNNNNNTHTHTHTHTHTYTCVCVCSVPGSALVSTSSEFSSGPGGVCEYLAQLAALAGGDDDTP